MVYLDVVDGWRDWDKMEKCYEHDGLVSVSLPNCSELGVVVLKKK